MIITQHSQELHQLHQIYVQETVYIQNFYKKGQLLNGKVKTLLQKPFVS